MRQDHRQVNRQRSILMDGMRDEGNMIAAPAGSLTCLELCAALGVVMVLVYTLLVMALVLLA